ncbi:lysophospholipid acyltransferase family protein [Desulforegula conservatrix]|uniref:lysophospholipid acyltransferase family protein n=1 Tax=Desulforegula conservatrix TaxID=153026 RepID=UPI0004132666|nr:lysophospholipid acyltransferase family protein [Desulforegula conservatrix]
MAKKHQNLITKKWFIDFVYYFIRAYSSTFRFRVENEEKWMNILKKAKPVLICTWHQQFFSAIRYFKEYSHLRPALMISKSSDGELIAGVANRTGWKTARGSSSRGGRDAMEAMIEHVKTYKLGAHVVDGPQGPIGIIKPGLIRIAQKSGAVLVPFVIHAESAWYFGSWDRFMLPKPFSKVVLKYLDPYYLKASNDPAVFEQQRQEIENIMLPYLVLK